MDMTIREAIDIVYNKLHCMETCTTFERELDDKCDNCEYCYAQGTLEQQIEAFRLAIMCMDNCLD